MAESSRTEQDTKHTVSVPDEGVSTAPERVRAELYGIVRQDTQFETKAREALELARAYLGADNGHLARVDRETARWKAVISTDEEDGLVPAGLELDLGATYCSHTVETNSRTVLCDASDRDWAEEALEQQGLHCYHGLPLVVGGEQYGTVCFVAEEPREQFSDDSLRFGRLVARLLERELEREQPDSRPTRQRELATTKYNALLDATEESVLVVDAETGEIRETNKAAERLTGTSRGDLVGRHYASIHPAADAGLYREAFDRARRTGANIQTLPDGSQPEVTAPDGGSVPVEVTTQMVSPPDGPAVLCLVSDVTLEQEVERLRTATSTIAHDLRNPLSVAQARVGLLRRESDSEHIPPVVDALDRIERLIEDVLTFARGTDAVETVTPVALADVVDSCRGTVDTGQASLVVTTERTVKADESRLQQLVENLLRNAIDHAGDDVTVTVGELDDGFYVADDGPGVPADERDRVFESGYSTSRDGTGFGLAIVRRIAASHGWTVSVTESDAGGARFELTGVEFTTG